MHAALGLLHQEPTAERSLTHAAMFPYNKRRPTEELDFDAQLKKRTGATHNAISAMCPLPPFSDSLVSIVIDGFSSNQVVSRRHDPWVPLRSDLAK